MSSNTKKQDNPKNKKKKSSFQGHHVQDKVFKFLRQNKTWAEFFMMDGSHLQGMVKSMDQFTFYVIVKEDNHYYDEMLFKHAISRIRIKERQNPDENSND